MESTGDKAVGVACLLRLGGSRGQRESHPGEGELFQPLQKPWRRASERRGYVLSELGEKM